MTDKLPGKTQQHLLSSMALQLNAQAEKLACVEAQLHKATAKLKEKCQYADNLEIDLEHALNLIKRTHKENFAFPSNKAWISRPVPGLVGA